MRTINLASEAKTIATELINIFNINSNLSLHDALESYSDYFNYDYKYVSIYNNQELINMLSTYSNELRLIHDSTELPALFSNDFLLFMLIKNKYENCKLNELAR